MLWCCLFKQCLSSARYCKSIRFWLWLKVAISFHSSLRFHWMHIPDRAEKE